MSDLTIRPMRAEDEGTVRVLYALCHPTWPAKSRAWYVTHPTLVGEIDGVLVGSTSFTLGPAPRVPAGSDDTMYGHGVYVHPDHQGRGLGRQLAQARMDLGRAERVRTFIGMTQPDNAPMQRIFAALGCKPYGRDRTAYPDGSTAVYYIGGL